MYVHQSIGYIGINSMHFIQGVETKDFNYDDQTSKREVI